MSVSFLKASNDSPSNYQHIPSTNNPLATADNSLKETAKSMSSGGPLFYKDTPDPALSTQNDDRAARRLWENNPRNNCYGYGCPNYGYGHPSKKLLRPDLRSSSQ